MAQMKLVTQFKQMFSRFCKDGKHAVFGYWQCNRGGYDQWFEIFFSRRNIGTVCDCVNGECNWFGNIKEIGITEAELEEIKKYITDHYPRTKFVEE